MPINTSNIKSTFPRSLKVFLDAETKDDILARAEDTAYIYASYPEGADECNYETLSILEIAAEEGKLEHVKALVEGDVVQYHEVFKSFFRALDAKQCEVALFLLDYINPHHVAKTQLVKSTPLQDEFHDNYLAKIAKTNHYLFRFNAAAVEGNIALIMAAGLPKADVFNRLLKNDALNNQLFSSGITALLSATLDVDCSIKKDINPDIVFQLLAIPHVANYAGKRRYDFGALLRIYAEWSRAKADTPKLSESFPSDVSLDGNEASRSSSVATTRDGADSRASQSPALYYQSEYNSRFGNFRPVVIQHASKSGFFRPSTSASTVTSIDARTPTTLGSGQFSPPSVMDDDGGHLVNPSPVGLSLSPAHPSF